MSMQIKFYELSLDILLENVWCGILFSYQMDCFKDDCIFKVLAGSASVDFFSLVNGS